MNAKDFRRLCAQAAPANKYGAQRSGGYASRREHRRGCELALLQLAGKISGLREQVPYLLIPAQRDKATGKVVERSCSYIADFVYTDCATHKVVVEDTKGFHTPEYIIKRKLMLYVHGISIREI